MSKHRNNSFLDVLKFIQDEHNLQLYGIPKNGADLRSIFFLERTHLKSYFKTRLGNS